MQIFELPGNPIAWQRARRKGNVYYDCQKNEKLAVQWMVKSQMKGIYSPFTAFKIKMKFYLPLKKKMPSNPFKTHRIIDIDNLVKFLFDALNGIVWADDSWIYEISAVKRYSTRPRTVIKVDTVKGDFLGCVVEDSMGETLRENES
jgi:Holliday junction resolvase RusA-like endonuclease